MVYHRIIRLLDIVTYKFHEIIYIERTIDFSMVLKYLKGIIWEEDYIYIFRFVRKNVIIVILYHLQPLK